MRVLCFNPDGRWLLTDDFVNDLGQIRDVESGRLLVELRGHRGYLLYAEFDSDGQRVLTASEDGTARIWMARTGQALTEPLRHKGVVRNARFSRDGRWVVTASEDATGQVWDSRTGRPVGEPLRHRDWVQSVEFSPDGRLVVTASRDGTARLWDALTGRPVAEPFEHHGNVQSARFSPDGRRVLTASDSGSAQLWDVPPTIPLPAQRSSRREEAHSSAGQSLLTSAATLRRAELPGVLLADLADVVIGKRVNAQGALESVSPAGLSDVRQRVSALLPREADFTRWLEWYLADRGTRTISPYSQVTVPQYIRSITELKNIDYWWREALMLCPTNGWAFAQMAADHLQLSQQTNSRTSLKPTGPVLKR